MHIELLFFPGCPHVDAARSQLRRACEALGVPASWAEVDVTEAGREGYGSPSILIDGHDVMGVRPGEGDARSCRLYAGTEVPGAPPLGALLAAMRGASA